MDENIAKRRWLCVLQIASNENSATVSFLQGSQAALNPLVTEDGQLLLTGNGSTLSMIITHQ